MPPEDDALFTTMELADSNQWRTAVRQVVRGPRRFDQTLTIRWLRPDCSSPRSTHGAHLQGFCEWS
jgi:hypothetical protein